MCTDRSSLIALAASGALALLSVGCPGSLENKEDFLGSGGGTTGTTTTTTGTGGGNPADDPCDGLITERCAVPGCHVPDRTAPDLSYEGRVERLVGIESPVCGGLLVDTSAPEQSVLYTKCVEEDPACGNQMPLTGSKLSEDDLACLLAWIETL